MAKRVAGGSGRIFPNISVTPKENELGWLRLPGKTEVCPPVLIIEI